MKTTMRMIFLACFATFSVQISCSQKSFKSQSKYLFKSKMVYDQTGYGQQILIRQPPLKNLEDNLVATDDRTVMARLGFTKQMKIDVLKELLKFQGDTTKSNKLYYIRGRWKNVEDKDFTIEIEALYSFTRMLTDGNTRILPVLINRNTREVVTGKRKEVDEIYSIYKKWLDENEKIGFEGFKFPLSNSAYDWLGGDEELDKYLKSRI